MREFVLESGVKNWLILLLLLSAVPVVCNAGVADTYEVQAEPHGGIPSNVAIDCIAHGTPANLWLATGRGAAYTPDGGLSWYSYDAANGLPSNNLSAIFSIGNRLWVGSSHEEYIGSELYSISDGITYTDDNGGTWTQVNFGEDGLNIDRVWGGDRTVFDITGHHDVGFLDNRATDPDVDWLFFASFAGGLLASQDGGESWRRIYASPSDSAQFQLTTAEPSYRNRVFASAVDTSHGDSLFLWTGTAGGAFQFVYAQPRDKFYQRLVSAIAFCDTCSGEHGGYVFAGGDNGVSRFQTTGGQFISRFVLDGLPGRSITAAISLGDRLLVGTADTTAGTSTGLAVSVDQGETFTPVAFSDVVGYSRTITEFAVHSGRLYMSAQTAGLLVSEDSGQNWERILIDSGEVALAINAANSVSSYADTLLVGTDSGLVELAFDGGGQIAFTRHEYFPESLTSSSRVMRARMQEFRDTLNNIDSTRVWTVNWPHTASGTPFVGRRSIEVDSQFFWSHYQVDKTTYDVNFWTDTAFVMGTQGIWYSLNGWEPTNRYNVRQYSGSSVVASLDNDLVTTMAIKADTVVLGTANGLALTSDRGKNWRIYRPVTDTLGADIVINHTFISSAFDLPGDFIPALGVEYQDTGPARIWLSCRPASEWESTGISVGEYVTDSAGRTDLRWQIVHETEYAWNFAFHNDTVFAATNAGLLMHDGSRDDSGLFVTDWDTIPLFDSASGVELVASGTAAYGVGVVDSFLWVGTDAGTVRINLDHLGQQSFFSRVDSTTPPEEVYAFPVPFSPGEGQTVSFHFVVSEAGNVTVEIYDFAMNLVARPIDNVYYDAGIYPSSSAFGATWDGYNDLGDQVAVGVYYFKVQLPSGDTRWGKLAVIP
jgi:hypothetical protein